MKIIVSILMGSLFVGVSSLFAAPIGEPFVQQRISQFDAIEIRGATPAGSFKATIVLQTNFKGELTSLRVTSSTKDAFKDLKNAGIHISESIPLDSLKFGDGASLIEVKDLKYNGKSIPISGNLLKAKASNFSKDRGGELTLIYTVNMVTGSTATISLSVRSKLSHIKDSDPEAYSRFWYVADEQGSPIDEIKVVANEWDLPFVGTVPVGVESLELGYLSSIEYVLGDYLREEEQLISKERAYERVENLQTTIRYLKMSMAYYRRVLSDLPKDHPSRNDFIEGRDFTSRTLARLEKELKQRSKNPETTKRLLNIAKK